MKRLKLWYYRWQLRRAARTIHWYWDNVDAGETVLGWMPGYVRARDRAEHWIGKIKELEVKYGEDYTRPLE